MYVIQILLLKKPSIYAVLRGMWGVLEEEDIGRRKGREVKGGSNVICF